MKSYKIKYRTGLAVVLLAIAMTACSDSYLDNYYIEPQASFSMEKETYDVLESVLFSNTGKAQHYAVWTGDEGHKYGKAFNSGFAVNSKGMFSYSYSEPGTYTVVWVASSVNSDGKVITAVDSTQISIIDRNGGLDKFSIVSIFRMTEYTGTVYYNSYGEFISPDTILCPILFAAWRTGNVNSIKAPIQMINFELASSKATLYWYDKSRNEDRQLINGSSATRFVSFMQDGKLATQTFRVVTASGITTNYYAAPVMIPAFTSFSAAGVSASIARDISYYDRYNVTLALPAGTDLSALQPEFVVMNNDPDLMDGSNSVVTVDGTIQTTGQSAVDFSFGAVTYDIKYNMLGESNPALSQTAKMIVTVTIAE